MRFHLSLLVAIFASVLPASVSAQQAPGPTPDWVRQFQAYTTSAQHQRELREAAHLFEAPRRGSCENVEFVRQLPIPLAPIAFDASGMPRNGTWLQKIFIRRCGEGVVHNVLYEVSNGVISQKGMVPGDTRAPHAHQESIANQVGRYLNQEVARVDDCRLLTVMNTRFLSQPTVGSDGAERWREEWTVQRCGRFDDVSLEFQAVRGVIRAVRLLG